MRSRIRPASLRVLLLFLVLVLLQVGPLADSAGADPPDEEEYPCDASSVGDYQDQYIGGGQWIRWVCIEDEFLGYGWHPGNYIPGGGRKTHRYFSSSNPPYRAVVWSAMAEGTGGGTGSAYADFRHPNNALLIRRIATRVIIRYRAPGSSTVIACHDSNWQEAPSQRHNWENHVIQYTQPDCGTGYYEARSAGRFYSISLNRWIATGWVFSGEFYMACTDPSCQ